MTEKAPGDAPNPAPPSEGLPDRYAITYDNLYWRLDSECVGAEAWVTATEWRIKEAVAKGDAAAVELHRRVLNYQHRRAFELRAVQTILNDIGLSPVCKAELAGLAGSRKKQIAADARIAADAVQCD